MRRQEGERLLLDAPGRGGWLGSGAQSISSPSPPPVNCHNGPQVCQGRPTRKISQQAPHFLVWVSPSSPRSVWLQTQARPDIQEPLQASSGQDGYVKKFPGLTQSLFHHSLGPRGSETGKKGAAWGQTTMAYFCGEQHKPPDGLLGSSAAWSPGLSAPSPSVQGTPTLARRSYLQLIQNQLPTGSKYCMQAFIFINLLNLHRVPCPLVRNERKAGLTPYIFFNWCSTI